MLSTIGKINLLEFIQRLDALVVFTFLITVFFKISIYFYGALIGMAYLFKVKNHQQIVLPTEVIIIFIIGDASDFSELIEEGINTTIHYLHIPFQKIIPLLMLLVVMIRNGFKLKAN